MPPMPIAHRRRLPRQAFAVLAGLLVHVGSAQAGWCPARAVVLGLPDVTVGDHIKGSGAEVARQDPGHLVEVLRDVAQRLGCSIEVKRLPVNRLVAAAAEGQLDLVAPVEARLAALQGLAVPQKEGQVRIDWALMHDSLYLAALKTRQDTLESAWKTQQAPQGTTSVMLGSAPARYASERGWKVQAVASHEQALSMLMLQRVDQHMAAGSVLDATEAVRSGRVVRLEPPVQLQHYFVGANPSFERRHEAFVQAFWQAMCQGYTAKTMRATDGASCKP